MKKLHIVGESIARPDARAKVDGSAVYCEDIQSMQGALHAGIIASPVAAGKIINFRFTIGNINPDT